MTSTIVRTRRNAVKHAIAPTGLPFGRVAGGPSATRLADNEKLGGVSGSGGGISVDESAMEKEEFNRNVQRVVRGEERTYRLQGIVIDQNLEAKDEGQTAAIFVMFIPVIVT